MKIALIGAGWYGCHIAEALLKQGHTIVLYEKNKDIFLGASGFNQNRFHRGLHYPRSYQTREQIIKTHDRFLEQYAPALHAVEKNIYAIAEKDSMTDFGTYLAILDGHQIPYTMEHPSAFGLRNVEGCVSCDEMCIDLTWCADHFRTLLTPFIRFGVHLQNVEEVDDGVLVDGERYDYCVNCTYNQFHPIPGLEVFYEPDLMLIYSRRDGRQDMAITIMDGDLASIYPLDKANQKTATYTLSSVQHTPLGKYETYPEAEARLAEIDEAFVAGIRPRFEEVFITYYPALLEEFVYEGFFTTTKTKMRLRSHSRELVTCAEGHLLHVFSGKINNIFLAEDFVLQTVKRNGGARNGN